MPNTLSRRHCMCRLLPLVSIPVSCCVDAGEYADHARRIQDHAPRHLVSIKVLHWFYLARTTYLAHENVARNSVQNLRAKFRAKPSREIPREIPRETFARNSARNFRAKVSRENRTFRNRTLYRPRETGHSGTQSWTLRRGGRRDHPHPAGGRRSRRYGVHTSIVWHSWQRKIVDPNPRETNCKF